MTDADALHAQIAQRLFGWTFVATENLYVTQDGNWIGWDLPAYTTDPVATAQVWRWLEQDHGVREISAEYVATSARITCTVYGRDGLCLIAEGTTWQEALCRAALALAERLGEEAHGDHPVD